MPEFGRRRAFGVGAIQRETPGASPEVSSRRDMCFSVGTAILVTREGTDG